MPLLLVDNLEHETEKYAFRRAIEPYEYADNDERSPYALRTFDEAETYVPPHPERTAFEVFCPVLEFFHDESTLQYHIAGIRYRRFPTVEKMHAFLKKQSPVNWLAFSPEELDGQINEVCHVLLAKPDRGEFLHLVRTAHKQLMTPEPSSGPVWGKRGAIRNPSGRVFQQRMPFFPEEIQAKIDAAEKSPPKWMTKPTTSKKARKTKDGSRKVKGKAPITEDETRAEARRVALAKWNRIARARRKASS